MTTMERKPCKRAIRSRSITHTQTHTDTNHTLTHSWLIVERKSTRNGRRVRSTRRFIRIGGNDREKKTKTKTKTKRHLQIGVCLQTPENRNSTHTRKSSSNHENRQQKKRRIWKHWNLFAFFFFSFFRPYMRVCLYGCLVWMTRLIVYRSFAQNPIQNRRAG